MNISLRGRIATGIGDSQIAIDRDVPAHLIGVKGGGTDFLSDVEAIYQRHYTPANGHEVVGLEVYNLVTGHATDVDPARIGANFLFAGGGLWCAWTAAHGYRDSKSPNGRTRKHWHPLALDKHTGLILVCLNYHDGSDLAVWDIRNDDPSTWLLTTVYEGKLDRLEASFDRGVVCFRAGGNVHLWDATQRQRSLPALPAVAGVQHSDGYLIGWHEGYGLAVYKAGQSKGVVLSSDGRDFQARILAYGDSIIVASASGALELPHELREYRLDGPTGLATLNGEPHQTRHVDLSIVPFVDEPVVDVPTFERAGYRKTIHTFGGIGFRMNLDPRQHDRDPNAAPSGAFYTIFRDDAALFGKLAYARQHRVPLFAYFDEHGQSFPMNYREHMQSICDISDVVVIPTLKTYPDESFNHVTDQLDKLIAIAPSVAICVAVYRQMISFGPKMNWSIASVVNRAKQIHSYTAGLRKVRHVLLFHQRREGVNPSNGVVTLDGVDSRPELALLQLRFIEATAGVVDPVEPVPEPTPVDPEPTPVEPEPVPTPEPTPVEPEPTPVPQEPQQPTVPVKPKPVNGGRKPNGVKMFKDLFRAIAKLFK